MNIIFITWSITKEEEYHYHQRVQHLLVFYTKPPLSAKDAESMTERVCVKENELNEEKVNQRLVKRKRK